MGWPTHRRRTTTEAGGWEEGRRPYWAIGVFSAQRKGRVGWR